MIKILPISGFVDNLPEKQLIEDSYKEIIKKNYSLSWFTPIDTPVVERLEVLTSKWWDDNEIYWIHRINWEQWDDSSLWLRFDLTVPLARYIWQYEWELTFPFRRQHIARSYRWERPQKWRFREFYQADVDIIWNWSLWLFADAEVISTIYNALKNLAFWDFVININNKKFLSWFLENLWINKIKETIWIIDKKDKLTKEALEKMFYDLWLDKKQILDVFDFIKFWEENDSKKILSNYSQIDNKMLKEGIEELKFVYDWLILLWLNDKNLRINSAISRGLDYYTWTVFETFISWAEKYWSIASWGRYENLTSNFSKNNYPWVWWSIWLTRLISILDLLWKINPLRKTTSKVLVLNMWDGVLSYNLALVENLRSEGINTEFYIDWKAKIQKQLKYANNKKIKYAVIAWDEEIKDWIVQLKNLDSWEQKTIEKWLLKENIN